MGAHEHIFVFLGVLIRAPHVFNGFGTHLNLRLRIDNYARNKLNNYEGILGN